MSARSPWPHALLACGLLACGAACAQPELASVEPLRALALRYEEAGDHAAAIVALEEARYVTRVHEGLSSAEEALLLRQQIRSERALGSHERVWNFEQDMVTIARQHLDDIRMAPIFRELAEERSALLAKYSMGERPPELYLGCYYAAVPLRYDDTRGERRAPLDGSCGSGSRSVVIGQIRAEIMMYYADAIEVIVKNGDYASQELRELEKQALRLSPTRLTNRSCRSGALDELLALPLLGSCLEPVIHSQGLVVANVGGWASLVRLIAYEVRTEAPPAARAGAIAELADWLLLSADGNRFDDNIEKAIAVYERANWELEQGGEGQASTAQIFPTDVPVTLPAFVPNPFASAATAAPSRYIDVSFDVTKHGQAEEVEIVDASKDATRGEKRDLIRLIESTSFRPRFVDGRVADSATVSVRYHLSP
jgi:hypothetical protein